MVSEEGSDTESASVEELESEEEEDLKIAASKCAKGTAAGKQAPRALSVRARTRAEPLPAKPVESNVKASKPRQAAPQVLQRQHATPTPTAKKAVADENHENAGEEDTDSGRHRRIENIAAMLGGRRVIFNFEC